MKKLESSFEEFKSQLLELSYLNSTLAVLGWDEQVYMPKKGGSLRAKTTSYLAGFLHSRFTSPEFEKLLLEIKKEFDRGVLTEHQAVIFREVYREFEKEKKLPLEFVKEISETTSKAHHIWAQARAKNDFKMYAPILKQIIDLKIKEAKYLGFGDSPYDALLDLYEPGMTGQKLDEVFKDLKEFLIPLIKKIKLSKRKMSKLSSSKINPKILLGNFPIAQQKQFGEELAKLMGFDFESGRLDISHHPFTVNFHPEDVRITTRYDIHNLWYSISPTIHEVGHALYEMGLPTENFGTPLGESISLGIHESQSRVWENQVGKSMSFWKFMYPKLKKIFPEPFNKIKIRDFYKAINFVKPSLIRTEADEVTYNLHIIIRFEIERDLIEGKIQDINSLPKIWNQKYEQYLGVKVPSDTQGILQDVHWSGGSFGYFPTYSLGNLYSAQIYHTAKKKIPNLEEKISKGELKSFREWLRKNIHIHGKFYKASDLIKNLTGEELNSKYFIDYLSQKYSQIYYLD